MACYRWALAGLAGAGPLWALAHEIRKCRDWDFGGKPWEEGNPLDAVMLRLDTRWPLSYVSLCSGIPEQLLEWDRYFHSLPPCYPPWGRPESWRTQLSPESEARQRRAAWRRGSPDIVDQVREAAAARMTARGTHSTNSHPPPPTHAAAARQLPPHPSTAPTPSTAPMP